MARDKIKIAFREQRVQAANRGIEFHFKFDEWVGWWEFNLGPDWFQKRGRPRGKYCMARMGDKGPYASWNVKCILSEENALEREQNGTLLFGESHGMCRINTQIARAIFLAEGSNSLIGKLFNVSRYSVANIKKRSNWRRATVDLAVGKTRAGRVRLHLVQP